MSAPGGELTPKQIAVLQAQLKAANERLLSIERRREQMQTYIATLTDQLKRAESEDRSKEC
jgi:uncharacterized protein YPO0396